MNETIIVHDLIQRWEFVRKFFLRNFPSSSDLAELLSAERGGEEVFFDEDVLRAFCISIGSEEVLEEVLIDRNLRLIQQRDNQDEDSSNDN